MQKFIYVCMSFMLVQLTSSAQDSVVKAHKHPQSIVYNSVVESNLIQFATLDQWNKSMTTIPRYTYFFNMGFDANFKVTNYFNLFTGLNMKNIGLIIKYNDSVREKHRVYTVGAPFGFKIHNLKNNVVFKTGVDVSVAVNYKWKHIVNDTKTKHNEWFSNRTALFFPSLFAGLSVKGVAVSANYYLNNFFNPLHPAVQNWDARLFTLGLGLNIDGSASKSKHTKKMKS